MRVRLAIETSNPSAYEAGMPPPGVAIGEVEGSRVRLVDHEPIDTRLGADDDLLPAIARLFARHSIAPSALESIAVSIGPGGYTALRIAAATAKVLAISTGASCIAVPSALVARTALGPRAGGKRVAVSLSSKDQTAYTVVFDASGRPTGESGLMGATELTGLDADLLVADRFLPVAMKAAALTRGLEVVPLILDAGSCLAASVGLAFVDVHDLQPHYPREPEAVTKWRKLHPPGTSA